MTKREFMKALKEAQKDQLFLQEIRKFIKNSTKINKRRE